MPAFVAGWNIEIFSQKYDIFAFRSNDQEHSVFFGVSISLFVCSQTLTLPHTFDILGTCTAFIIFNMSVCSFKQGLSLDMKILMALT